MARLVFFRWTPEGYVGDDTNGLLVGTGWADEFGNGHRAIVFQPDFSQLKFQNEIAFYYDLEIQPEGMPEYIHSDTKTLPISNSVLVDYDPATTVLKDVFKRNAPTPTTATPIPQLDLFIGLYFKGTIAPPVSGLPPIYELLTDLIIDIENPVIVFLEETLRIVEALAAIGIILTDAQVSALDTYLRNHPEPVAMSGEAVPGHVTEFLKTVGVSV